MLRITLTFLAFRSSLRLCRSFGTGGARFVKDVLGFFQGRPRDLYQELQRRDRCGAHHHRRDTVGLQHTVDVVGLHFRIHIRGAEQGYQVEVVRRIHFRILILRHGFTISQNEIEAAEENMSEPVHDELENCEDQTSNRIAWFLVGVVIGATASILYAPKSGKDTRDFLAQKGQAGRDAVESTGREAIDKGHDIYLKGRQLVEDAADLFERGRKLVHG